MNDPAAPPAERIRHFAVLQTLAEPDTFVATITTTERTIELRAARGVLECLAESARRALAK